MLRDDCQLWVSLIQFAFFPSPFMPISWPPIKNAPRWLVKGRWEWRLGLFKDLSQLFRSKFDSENGGGLISHAEVFRRGSGTEWNARRSDESSAGINQKWNVCCQLGLTSFDSGSQQSCIYTTTPLKTDGGWISEVGNSARRSFVSVPFWIYEIYLAGTVQDDIRQRISFEFVFVSRYPLGPYHSIFITPETAQSRAFCYQILPFKSYWHHIEEKYIKALSYPAGWRADRPKHIAAEGDGARVRKTTRSSRQRRRGGEGRRIREMLKQGWCKRMREKRRGRSVEESSGGGLHTKTDEEYQEAARYTRKGAEIVKREVRTKNGGTERLFNDRQRTEPTRKKKKGEEKGRGLTRKRLKSRKGKQQTDRQTDREREVERVRESQRQMSPSLAPADW